MNKFLRKHWKSLSVWASLIVILLSVAVPITAQVAGNSVLFRRTEDIWALMNMTTGNGQTLEIYNSNDTSPFTNYEKVSMGWAGNAFTTTYSSSGTGAASRVIQGMTYSNAGTQKTGFHTVAGQALSSSGLATIALSASAAFGGTNTYYVAVTDATTATFTKVTHSSPTQFVITSSGSDSVDYIATGN